MVKSLLAIVCAALFALVACSQASDSKKVAAETTIQVSLVQSERTFTALQQVEVRVHNMSDRSLSYTCAVEVLSEAEWFEISPSIHPDDPPRGTRILELKPNAEAVFSVSPPPKSIESFAKGTFRVKATALEGERILAESVTEAFRIDPGSSVEH